MGYSELLTLFYASQGSCSISSQHLIRHLIYTLVWLIMMFETRSSLQAKNLDKTATYVRARSGWTMFNAHENIERVNGL